MRETYSTIRHLLHLATELDRACALFLSTHISITHDEARVLLELGAAQQSLRPGALAKQLNLQPSTLSRVLRNLENRGFIERHRTTEDARSLSLSLTYLGARTAKETEQTLDRFFDGLGKHLGYDDLDGLLNAFQTQPTICRAAVLRAKPHRRKRRVLSHLAGKKTSELRSSALHASCVKRTNAAPRKLSKIASADCFT